MKLWKLN